MKLLYQIAILLITTSHLLPLTAAEQRNPHNVLLIISDDLTATALGCYGNKTCRTPNIDKLASEGTRFTRAYCQATICGPSRASMLFGYYPYATKATGYTSGREKVGPNRDSWPQYFRKHGYHSARISKVFHMGVPTDIGPGNDGADDPASWDEVFNSRGPESQAPGTGETLQNNPNGLKLGAAGGNRFSVVEAEGDDLVHSDGKTAQKAVELLNQYKGMHKPFFLAIGFVRPHVPLVAPRKYFAPYALDEMFLPPKIPGDWDDIPANSVNRRTSEHLQMDINQQKKLIRAYYASVSFMDAMTGKVMEALEQSGQRDNTIVIFTSDHGFHLGEQGLWTKANNYELSTRVPLLISIPGQTDDGIRSSSLVELLDVYPTLTDICGLPGTPGLQGTSLIPLVTNPGKKVKSAVVSQFPRSLSGNRHRGEGDIMGYALRTEHFRYVQWIDQKKDTPLAEELYDHRTDSGEMKNLLSQTGKHREIERLRNLLRETLNR